MAVRFIRGQSLMANGFGGVTLLWCIFTAIKRRRTFLSMVLRTVFLLNCLNITARSITSPVLFRSLATRWAVGNMLARMRTSGRSTMAGGIMAIMALHVLIMRKVVPMSFGLLRLLVGVVLGIRRPFLPLLRVLPISGFLIPWLWFGPVSAIF